MRLSLTLLGIAVAGHLILSHFVRRTEGPSMLPTIDVTGNWTLTLPWYRRGRGIVVGDVVSSADPFVVKDSIIKRVVGLPGDFICVGADPEFGNGGMIQVPAGHCWLSGDNAAFSKDSRHYGPIPLALIKGKVVAVVLPWSRMRWIKNGLERLDERGLA
jgi:inner membrane protease subunit 1